MKIPSPLVCLALLATCGSAYAGPNHQHKAHVHGLATVNIVQEGLSIVIELDTPAMNILGFEHQPKSDEQKQILNKALTNLSDYRHIISFDHTTCKQSHSELISPFNSEAAPHAKENEHAEFLVSYELLCDSDNVISAIQINAFSQYPGMEEMQINWLTANGQGAKKISAKTKTLQLK